MPKVIDYDKVKKYYEKGYDDPTVAKKAGTTQSTVYLWRKKYKLPPNSRLGLNTRYVAANGQADDKESLFNNREFVETIVAGEAEPAPNKRKRWWTADKSP